MNVLFFYDVTGVGGPEVWAVDTIQRLQDKGHQVYVGCPSGSWMAEQASVGGIPFFDYLIEDAFEDHLRWQLVEHLKAWKIDLVLCSIPGMRVEVPILDAAIREAGRGGILLRVGIMPLGDLFFAERLGVGYETVQGIIAVSQGIRDCLIERFGDLNLPEIQVCYNGVDLDRFTPCRQSDQGQVLQQYDICNAGPIIGAVGRLDAIKNLSALVKAAPRVVAKFPNAQFVLAGDGREKQDLVALAEAEGVLAHFHFVGFVEDVPRFLHEVDVFVHPAWMEGLPNAVMEAMAMQKPVVASWAGGVAEIVENEKTGLLFEPDDAGALAGALCRVLSDKALSVSLGMEARSHVMGVLDRRKQFLVFEDLLFKAVSKVKTYNTCDKPQMGKMPDLFFPVPCRYHHAKRF